MTLYKCDIIYQTPSKAKAQIYHIEKFKYRPYEEKRLFSKPIVSQRWPYLMTNKSLGKTFSPTTKISFYTFLYCTCAKYTYIHTIYLCTSCRCLVYTHKFYKKHHPHHRENCLLFYV